MNTCKICERKCCPFENGRTICTSCEEKFHAHLANSFRELAAYDRFAAAAAPHYLDLNSKNTMKALDDIDWLARAMLAKRAAFRKELGSGETSTSLRLPKS